MSRVRQIKAARCLPHVGSRSWPLQASLPEPGQGQGRSQGRESGRDPGAAPPASPLNEAIDAASGRVLVSESKSRLWAASNLEIFLETHIKQLPAKSQACSFLRPVGGVARPPLRDGNTESALRPSAGQKHHSTWHIRSHRVGTGHTGAGASPEDRSSAHTTH